VTARVWGREGRAKGVASVEARVAAALAKRRKLLDDDSTDALRLIHGEADALPGLAVDRLGPLLRVLVTGRACEPVIVRTIDALLRQLMNQLGSDPPVVRVVHLADPPSAQLRAAELVRGNLDGITSENGRLEVHESGLVFQVDPGLVDAERGRPGTGLFLDQRENRARVRRASAGGSWLNLFCHTGAFSAAALSGGAREVVSVDLSARYLAWLEDNLHRNGLAGDRHRSVRKDVRQFLARLDPAESFDGIVLDPPTAARAGRRFWSPRRDGGALLSECLGRLRPGGMLLVCRHDRGPRGVMAPLVHSVADAAGIELTSVEEAPPGPDFPRMASFPEGDAFEGVVATRRP
jgi:23S rRNA (cytosine1962-C5)-methyltransferase